MRLHTTFRMIFILAVLLSGISVFGQNLSIQYRATVRTTFSEEEKKEFLESFTDRKMGQQQLEMNMNPDPVTYRLTIFEDAAVLEFLPKIKNSQDPDEVMIFKAPSGFNPVFTGKDGRFIQEEEIYGRNYQIVDSLKILEIQNIQPSENVLGFRTLSGEANKDGVQYQILYTSDLPAEFGPDYFRIKEGLMLKVNFSKPEWKSEIVYETVEKDLEN